MISKSFIIQLSIALITLAPSLTFNVNAAAIAPSRFVRRAWPRISERAYTPLADRQLETPAEATHNTQANNEAISDCNPSSADTACFTQFFTSDADEPPQFDLCAASPKPGICFQSLCPNADQTTIDCFVSGFTDEAV